MVVKIYLSGISGNKEVKKRQQRVLMILDSKLIKYEEIDVAEPGNEEAKEFMQNNSKSMGATVGDTNPRSPLPPQIFNDQEYCGDYDQFDLANEMDEIEKFLKLAPADSGPVVTSSAELKLGNGDVNSDHVDKVEVETSNEAEAKPSNEAEGEQENEEVQNDNKAEETKENEKETEKEEDEEAEEEQTETDSKVEKEADSDLKENGTAEADSTPTEIEA